MPRDEPVAVMLVNGFTGLGVHTVLSVQNLFPHQFRSYLFVSVGVIDSAIFKGHCRDRGPQGETDADLEKYVAFAHKLGFKAEYRYDIGTEAVESVVELCERGPAGVSAFDLLSRPARVRERSVLLPRAAQRDGVRDPAPPPVRGAAGGRPPDPRSGAEEERAEEGVLTPEASGTPVTPSGEPGSSVRSTASRAGTFS